MANGKTKKQLVKTITDPRTKKRIYFYGKSEREINKKILEYSARVQTGRPFMDVAEEWWGEAEPNLAYQSAKVYKPAMKRAVKEFGNSYVKDILPKNVENYLKKLAKLGLAQKTVNNQRLVLSLILDHAVVEGDIVYNPCKSVTVPKGLTKSTRKSATSTDEDIILKSYDVWLFPYVALMTGMRKGEILALKWQDIDFDENYISVTKSVYHIGDKPYIKEPKTEAGVRMVPLLEPLKEVLLKINERPANNYIFSDDGKTPLTNRRYITLSKHFKEETGVECTAHQLRHSYATRAFECELEPKAVQEILGHKQISTTLDMYTEFRKKALNSAADKLNQSYKK